MRAYADCRRTVKGHNMQLTLQQTDCLDRDRNIVVRAGAGSGKTRVLVERFFDLLRSGATVSQIVAITFTRKAAAEMIERIKARVREQIEAGPDDHTPWREIQADLGAAAVSTIHAFCERMLRDFPLAASVEPEFQVLDEIDAGQMRRDAVAETLHRVSRSTGPTRDALARLLDAYGLYDLRKTLRELLDKRRVASACFGQFLADGPPAYLERLSEEYLERQRPALQQLLADDELAGALRQILAFTPKNPEDKGYIRVQTAAEPISAFLAHEGPVSIELADAAMQILDTFLTKEGTAHKKFPGNAKNWAAGECREFKELACTISDVLAPYHERILGALPETEECFANTLADLQSIFSASLDTLWDLKGHGSLLDFDDLEDRTTHLFQESPDAPRVLATLRRRYRHILVDEFQDTNMAQWQIISPLLQSADQRFEAHRGFLVGDAKQSIYGFRQADVRMMRRATDAFQKANRRHGAHRKPLPSATTSEEERLGVLPLSDNFRSLPTLIDFTNFLFDAIMVRTPDEFEIAYAPMQGARGSADDPPGHVEIIIADPRDDERDDSTAVAVAAEGDVLAQTIRRIVDQGNTHRVLDPQKGRYVPASYGHMAILLRRYRHGPVYEAALRRSGIPYAAYKGMGFFERQEVLDVMNLLSFLASELDDIALAGVLRGPLMGLSDEGLFWAARGADGTLWERINRGELPPEMNERDREALARARRLLRKWREVAGRVPAADFVRTVLDDTALWGIVQGGIEGQLREANLRKLLDIVRSLENKGLSGLRDIADRLRELAETEDKEGLAPLDVEEQNAVKIMTVHAAKGLDFPIVLVPDMTRPITHRSSDRVLMDPEVGIGVGVPVGKSPGREGVRSVMYDHLSRLMKARETAEEKRLFYVACTRARDELCLIGRGKELDVSQSWWRWLAEAFHITAVTSGTEGITFRAEGASLERRIPLRRLAPADVAASGPTEVLADSLPPAPSHPPPLEEKVSRDIAFLAARRSHPILSPTAIIEFTDCPARYYLTHVAHLSEEVLQDPTRSGGTDRKTAQALGTVAHALLENLSRLANDSPEQILNRARTMAERFAEFTPEETARLTSRAADMVLRFRETPRFAAALRSAEHFTEMPFLLNLGPAAIDGRMDLLYHSAAGDWTIVDYKTSPAPDTDDLTPGYRTQMQVYALAVRDLFRTKRVEVVLVFLQDEPVEVRMVLEEPELNAAEKSLAESVEAMLAVSPAQLQPTHTERCDTCPFGRVCASEWLAKLDARKRSVATSSVTT